MRSSSSAAWSSRLRPGANSTRRSTSLLSVSWPRATEPKKAARHAMAPQDLAERRQQPRRVVNQQASHPPSPLPGISALSALEDRATFSLAQRRVAPINNHYERELKGERI